MKSLDEQVHDLLSSTDQAAALRGLIDTFTHRMPSDPTLGKLYERAQTWSQTIDPAQSRTEFAAVLVMKVQPHLADPTLPRLFSGQLGKTTQLSDQVNVRLGEFTPQFITSTINEVHTRSKKDKDFAAKFSQAENVVSTLSKGAPPVLLEMLILILLICIIIIIIIYLATQ
jgi:hypothetical protein